jgi:hypothetical protein
MRHAVLLPMVALTGCVGIPPRGPYSATASRFSAQQFFAGRTEGQSVLKKAFSKPEQVRVEGHGTVDRDGMLVLDQTVIEGTKAATHRQWRIQEVSPGHYAGTLTSANGPIEGDAHGNRLHLHFRMKGGLDAQQWLTLAPDARSAHNVMVVRKFGIVVGTLDETIRKIG